MQSDGNLEILFDGKHIQLQRRDHWEFAARKTISGIVGIIAVTDDRKLLLVEQYRPPVDAKVIELPAGLAGDVPGHATEDLATAAKRELLEETGYQATDWQIVCDGTTSAGITNEVITLFLATRLKKISTQHGEATESIVLHEIPLAGIDDWLASQRQSGKLIAMKVYAGLYFAERAYKEK
jgi:ADP-ribose pyrophosphatase